MLKKHVEGKNAKWIIDLEREVEDQYGVVRPLYMDSTYIIEDAIRRDVKRGYPAEKGPYFAIEARRIEEYTTYVMEWLSRDNYYRFDTRFCKFFPGSIPVKKSPNPSTLNTGE